MDTGLNTTNLELDSVPEPVPNPDIKWIIWGVWSALTLAAVLFAVLIAEFDTALLLGWAVASIVAAMMMVFWRK